MKIPTKTYYTGVKIRFIYFHIITLHSNKLFKPHTLIESIDFLFLTELDLHINR